MITPAGDVGAGAGLIEGTETLDLETLSCTLHLERHPDADELLSFNAEFHGDRIGGQEHADDECYVETRVLVGRLEGALMYHFPEGDITRVTDLVSSDLGALGHAAHRFAEDNPGECRQHVVMLELAYVVRQFQQGNRGLLSEFLRLFLDLLVQGFPDEWLLVTMVNPLDLSRTREVDGRPDLRVHRDPEDAGTPRALESLVASVVGAGFVRFPWNGERIPVLWAAAEDLVSERS